jgi:hypothetical protein
MPLESGVLKIEVKLHDDETFETVLCCALIHCGKTVIIDSNGPKTVQNVKCPGHGLLITFPDQMALGEFVRLSANKILAADGHVLIEPGALSIFGDEPSLPESMN